LSLSPPRRSALWIVPSPLARDQTLRALAARWAPGDPEPRVHCWDDLWRWVASASKFAPVLLSDSAAAGVFDQAVRDVGDDGRLGGLADLIALPGWRRRLRRLLRGWTIAERHREKNVEDESAEWSVFLRYRQLLGELDAEDEAGLAVWASIRLRDRPAATSSDGDHLVFLDFDGRAPARWRVLTDALARPRSIDATLAFCDDPALGELYLTTASIRGRLLELGLVETPLPSSPDRPAGLRAVEDRLFREEPAPSPPVRIETGAGLTIRGGPEGENLGRLVAREVRSLLGQGVDPDDVLIVFPQWGDQADVVCETLRRAGLPVHDASPRPLDLDPSIAALLQAARIPIEDWEAELVVRLLRNGQLHPDWEDAAGLGLAEAASALRDAPVFRGSRQILRALARAMARAEPKSHDAQRLQRAHGIAERLVETLGPLDQRRPWSGHASALKSAAAELGLGQRDGRGLAALWDALDDRSDVLEKLGRGGAPIGWTEFVDALASLAAETPQPQPPPAPGAIRTASVDEIEGCRASFVLLVGLVEGSFPRRSAAQRFLATRPGEEPSDAARRGHADEMLRFLRVLGAADRGALLVYPTTDAKGQPLLRAGFLDELLGALAPSAEAAIHQSHSRFHPALLDGEDLAVSPADRLVLASALAGERNQLAKLRELARDPSQGEALAGAAAALRALDARSRGTPLGEYEGLIADEAAIAEIAKSFGNDYTFSPSQLETYLNCPFQFFARHVLHLRPPEERDELDEDFTERGSRLHDILEKFESLRLQAGEEYSDEDLLKTAIEESLARDLDGMSELDRGLHEIERRQIERATSLYIEQRAKYVGDSPAPPIPERLEYGFGEDETEFVVENGSETVKLQGWIDRVDRVMTELGPIFRVIDYKSGKPPSSKDVIDGWMLQLPLYAMAVERLLCEDGEFGPPDMGYWGLKEPGYGSVKFKTSWDEIKRATTERVFDVLRRLRSGAFAVTPRRDHCETYCEYRSVCRIRQIRAAGKAGGEEDS